MSANGSADSPIGLWSGVATYDGRTDEITLDFRADGTVSLRTAASAGQGTWAAAGPGRFTYHLIERLPGGDGPGGHVDIRVDARIEGAAYHGTSTADIRDAAGTVVHTVSASVAARRVGASTPGAHARKTTPAA